MVRRWYTSITTTIVITVIASMMVGLTLQQASEIGRDYLGFGPHRLTGRQGVRTAVWLPSRIADLIEILDTIPNAERPAAIAAATQDHLHIDITDAPLPNPPRTKGRGTDLLRRRIEHELKKPRTIIAAVLPAEGKESRLPDDTGSENGIAVETPLSDGHWLIFRTDLNLEVPANPVATNIIWGSFVLWTLLFAASAVTLSMFAAKRLAGPLSELSAAVEQLGGSGNAPLITPRGPHEVQTTIRAFNRMQERISRFNDDRTRMLAAMSHDLRTPITRLQLRLEMLEIGEHRQKMLADLEIMGEMIESSLSFARDDTKHEPRSLVDLSSLVEGICEDAADAGEAVTFSGPRSVTISCRPTAIRRAISNLIDNAVKYGGCAQVALALDTDGAIVVVDDKGPGIPRAERDKVFEPFYRIERSRNVSTGGVGLGLAVTRSIMWEHGGDIILSNRRGGGLRAKLELPFGPGFAHVAQEAKSQDVTDCDQSSDRGNKQVSITDV